VALAALAAGSDALIRSAGADSTRAPIGAPPPFFYVEARNLGMAWQSSGAKGVARTGELASSPSPARGGHRRPPAAVLKTPMRSRGGVRRRRVQPKRMRQCRGRDPYPIALCAIDLPLSGEVKMSPTPPPPLRYAGRMKSEASLDG